MGAGQIMCSCNGDIFAQSTSLTFSGPFSISIYHLFWKEDSTITTVCHHHFLPLPPNTEGSNSQTQIKMSSLFMKSCILTLFSQNAPRKHSVAKKLLTQHIYITKHKVNDNKQKKQGKAEETVRKSWSNPKEDYRCTGFTSFQHAFLVSILKNVCKCKTQNLYVFTITSVRTNALYTMKRDEFQWNLRHAKRTGCQELVGL